MPYTVFESKKDSNKPNQTNETNQIKRIRNVNKKNSTCKFCMVKYSVVIQKHEAHTHTVKNVRSILVFVGLHCESFDL